MEPSSSSEVVRGDFKNISWLLKSFGTSHDLLTVGHATSSVVEFENPSLSLRYFLQPVEKLTKSGERIYKYYNLCVELLKVTSNCVVNVFASIDIPELETRVSGDGSINVNESKKGQDLVIIDEFLPVQIWYIDTRTGVRVESRFPDESLWHWLWRQNDVTINLSTQLYVLHQDGVPEQLDITSEASSYNIEPTGSQLSLLSEIITMYTTEDDNYPDFKIETKDNVILNAHKFIVAARSVVFRKLIDDQENEENSGGTIKIDDINAKALVVILHWMYTGELHENAGKEVEEVVEASVKYELSDLLKLLENQLITICNPENMFHLHQVAKKYEMTTAIKETAAYIRGNV